MDETSGNNQGSNRGNGEKHSQPDNTLATMGKHAMGSTPKTTVGWAAIVACLSALLYLSGQFDSKIDGRVDAKINPIKAVYDEKFSTISKQLDENKTNIKAVTDELNSRKPKR